MSDLLRYSFVILDIFPQTVPVGNSLSASHMESTIKLLRKRVHSRMDLHKQFVFLGLFFVTLSLLNIKFSGNVYVYEMSIVELKSRTSWGRYKHPFCSTSLLWME